MKSEFQHPVKFGLAPSGIYDMRVIKVLTIPWRDPYLNNRKSTNMYWRILDGIFAGKTVHTIFNRDSDNGIRAYKRALKSMMLDPSMSYSDEQLVGRKSRVTLKIGTNKQNIATWFERIPGYIG